MVSYKFPIIGKQVAIILHITSYHKLKLRVFLADHIVVMVTNCATKFTATCLPMIGQFFDTMIFASIDKEWL